MPTAISRLFVAMDAVGPGADRQYEEALQTFLTRPGALQALRETYAKAAAWDPMRRWMAVNVAAQLPGSESLAFMESVLYEHPNIDASSRAALAREQPARFRAALGVISGFIESRPGYDAALARLLTHAEPSVARFAAIDLFNRNRLNPEMRATLDARGLESSFQRMGLDQLPALARMEAELSAARRSGFPGPGRSQTPAPTSPSTTLAE
jgi:hypothetical protein